MKKSLLTLALAAIQLAVFAQGKVTFGNDANHLITVEPMSALPGGMPWLAGKPVPQIGTVNDMMSSLTAQLFAGPTPDSLTLQSTMNPAGLAGLADGRLNNVAVTLTGILGGANAYFQILIYETRCGSYNAAYWGYGNWYGSTPVFSGRTGGFAPTPLTTFSSWTPGPVWLVYGVPEPATYVLFLVGATTLLVLRRWK
jgi:hypothetical protein